MRIVGAFGALFIIHGLAGFIAIGLSHWTALLPAVFGGILLGLAAMGAKPERRATAGGLVCAAALIWFVAVVRISVSAGTALVRGESTTHLDKITSGFQLAMGLISLALVVTLFAAAVWRRPAAG